MIFYFGLCRIDTKNNEAKGIEKRPHTSTPGKVTNITNYLTIRNRYNEFDLYQFFKF